AAYLWIERQRKNPYTGVFPLSLAVLLQICSTIGRTKDAVPPDLLKDPVFAWHTGSAAVAMASFSLGAMYGLLFLGVYRLLKRGKSTPFILRMPSLDVLAGMTVLATRLGFVALTLAVALGFEWALRTPGAELFDPKIVATLVVWLVYGTALVGHRLMRWGGWRVVSMTLGAYGVMLFSLMVMGRLVSSFHRFVE
ncbi:MAG: cytochrome c biogenesis protein CcsA, partial [Planctomycetota bacterium]